MLVNMDAIVTYIHLVLMKSLLNIFIVFLGLLSILSCTPSAPYEIKSPCVSIENDSPGTITPCIRRPVNISRAIV